MVLGRTKKVTKEDVEATLGSLPTDEKPTPEPPAKEKAAKTPRRGSLERQLRDTFETIGAMLILKGDLVCGTTVTQQAPEMAKAWDNLASSNRVIQKWMEAITTGGAATEVLTSMFPIIIAATAHHGPDPRKAEALGMPDHKPLRMFKTNAARTQVIPVGNNGTGEADVEDVISVS